MQSVQAHFVALPQNYESNGSKVLAMLTTFLEAVAEGISKARQYEALAHKSDIELTARGLSREHLAHFVMFGKT